MRKRNIKKMVVYGCILKLCKLQYLYVPPIIDKVTLICVLVSSLGGLVHCKLSGGIVVKQAIFKRGEG